MAGCRQREDVEVPEPLRPILADDPVDQDVVEDREAVLPEVVVVVERPHLPMDARALDQVPLGRRCPDADARSACAREALRDIAVVVRQQDVGDAVDPEVVQVIEDIAAAEIDEDPGSAGAQQIDVHRVDETRDVPPELHGPSLASGPRQERRLARADARMGPRIQPQNSSHAVRSPGISVTVRIRPRESSMTSRDGMSSVRSPSVAVVRRWAATTGPPLASSETTCWRNVPFVRALSVS